MNKKFVVLIEDDFEVMGNGLGNVEDLQYLPALSFMNIAQNYDAKITFMVDVAHQLQLKAHSKIPELEIQSNLWEKTILMMKEKGHDVQLHLHPQWINAKYKNGFFYLNENWNIGRCTNEEQSQLISESIKYLESLICPYYSNYSVIAFKAGSWGLQPSENLFHELENNGISIVLGARDNLKIDEQGLNYSGMEEKSMPYYPDYKDITKISNTKSGVVMIPLQSYSPDLITLSKYIFSKIKNKLFKDKFHLKTYNAPDEIINLRPLKGTNSINFGFRPYQTHLKIGDTPFSYLKNSFDKVVKDLSKIDSERIPIVIESHTKQFHNHYEDIENFIAYINKEYSSIVEFGDLTSFQKEIAENPNLAIYKNEN